jgi:hypothetical protein
LAVPKSSSFAVAVFQDDNIVGLQVPMDDKVLMCKANSGADGLEEFDAPADRE